MLADTEAEALWLALTDADWLALAEALWLAFTELDADWLALMLAEIDAEAL